MDIQEEIANALHQADCGCGETVGEHDQPYWAQARALMPLVKRAQAEALREAARVFVEGEWAGAFMRGEVDDDVSAVQATDQWFNCRADRIERGETA